METNLRDDFLSLINSSLAHIYCNTTLSNQQLTIMLHALMLHLNHAQRTVPSRHSDTGAALKTNLNKNFVKVL